MIFTIQVLRIHLFFLLSQVFYTKNVFIQSIPHHALDDTGFVFSTLDPCMAPLDQILLCKQFPILLSLRKSGLVNGTIRLIS